jgi:putative methionine-R-sulfoxide reductase with GAF domain
MSQRAPGAGLRLVGETIAAHREALVVALASALRFHGSIGADEAATLSEGEVDALLEALRTGDVVGLLARDAANLLATPRGGSAVGPVLATMGSCVRCCAPFLESLEPAARQEALLDLHELFVRRLEGLLRAEEDDLGRRLAETQDQLARADERAALATRENEGLRRAEERSRHRAEQIALLGAVTRRIAGILDPDRLMQEAAAAIQARMNHTFVAVVVLDEEGALVGRWAGRPGVTRESAGRSRGPTQGIIGRALRKRAPQVVGDVTRDADYRADVVGTRSEMVVPLMRAGEVVGALDFQSEKAEAFDLDDVVAAEILAEFLVVALRNARLFAGRDEPEG